jgi:hypothetical protein
MPVSPQTVLVAGERPSDHRAPGQQPRTVPGSRRAARTRRRVPLLMTAAALSVLALIAIVILGGLAGDILAGLAGGLALAAVHECANRSSSGITSRGAAWRARRHRG